MDSFEWNKVFAALIAGALLVMVIGTVTGSVLHQDTTSKLAYTIEVASPSVASADAVVEEGPSLAELLAVASVDKGAKQFNKCKSCHTVNKGGKQGTGPNLFAIVDRGVANVEGFRYSSALREIGGAWDYATLDAWLESPKRAVPGNTMSFAGLRKAGQRADLIAYLRAQADSLAPLPLVEAAAETVSESVTQAETTNEDNSVQ